MKHVNLSIIKKIFSIFLIFNLTYVKSSNIKKQTSFKVFLTTALLTFVLGNSLALPESEGVQAIKAPIIEKVINNMEAFINNQTNTIANSFGKGKTTIGIEGIESKKPNYHLDIIQPLSKLYPDTKALTFIQGSVFSSKNEGSRRNTLNFGIGKRLLIDEDKAIVGANLFYDRENSSKHLRTSFGLEYQRTNFGVTSNYYHPLSDKKTIDGYTEEALQGYDIQLTGQMPYIPWAKVKVTQSYWDQITGDNINASKIGVQVALSPSISFEFGQEDSNTSNQYTYGKLSIQLPFTKFEKLTNFAIDSKPFKARGAMSLTSLALIERSKQIKIEKINKSTATVTDDDAFASGDTFNGLVYLTVTSPDTGKVWLDRNLGATQVCASSTDSACYGDLYQWGRAADGHQSRTLDVTGSVAGNETTNTTTTRATSISSVGAKFIKTSLPGFGTIHDWVENTATDSNNVDDNGALRKAAWADGGANDICPVGFGVATKAEMQADTLDATTVDVTNSATAYESFLKIPLAGHRRGQHGDIGQLNEVGTVGFLWVRHGNSTASLLDIESSSAVFSGANRVVGGSIRCIKD